jgi:hypothetical protein
MKPYLAILALGVASTLTAKQSAPTISGSYLEVRSCDVYTGYCFANGEMNLSGKEGMMVWTVGKGSWAGTPLDGLSVIAVVRADGTLGDVRFQPRAARSVLIVDARADAKQREALCSLAHAMAGGLLRQVAGVETASIESSIGTCTKAGCASVKAGKLVEINTRCLGGKDHVCGNEETYYPPLTDVQATPAFTEVASFNGEGLNLKWENTGSRSAFVGTFSR